MEIFEIIEEKLKRLDSLFNELSSEIPKEVQENIIGITHNYINNTNIREHNIYFTELLIKELTDFIKDNKQYFNNIMSLIDEFISYFLIVLASDELFAKYIIEEEFISELIFKIIDKII